MFAFTFNFVSIQSHFLWQLMYCLANCSKVRGTASCSKVREISKGFFIVCFVNASHPQLSLRRGNSRLLRSQQKSRTHQNFANVSLVDREILIIPTHKFKCAEKPEKMFNSLHGLLKLWTTRFSNFKNRDSQNPNGQTTPQIGAPKSSKKLQKAQKCSLATETVTSVLCVRCRTEKSAV
jgi:hypothetical protein